MLFHPSMPTLGVEMFRFVFTYFVVCLSVCLDILLIDNFPNQGPLVYVNYGRQNDFRYLTLRLGLNLTGYICIARYGEIFRGDKV